MEILVIKEGHQSKVAADIMNICRPTYREEAKNSACAKGRERMKGYIIGGSGQHGNGGHRKVESKHADSIQEKRSKTNGFNQSEETHKKTQEYQNA